MSTKLKQFEAIAADLAAERAPILKQRGGRDVAPWMVAAFGRNSERELPSLPVMAGGDVATPMAHPLGPPTVSGPKITVDMMLNQPTRVTRMIMDLSLQRFIADRVFASAGGVTGGAVIYDQAVENELYATRDVEKVAPGAEFPEITFQRRVPQVAQVEKWGGKFWTSDEARDRNAAATFTNSVRQLTNTIILKLNQRALQELANAVSANARTASGNNWSTVITGGSSQSNATLWPAADFAKAAQLAETDELGVVYDLWLLNPQEYARLITIYGANNLPALLNSLNITVYVSNRVTAGTAYVVASQQVGEMRLEQPLASESWRQQRRQRTWLQSSVRPVWYVTNPFAVLQFTGLAG